MRGVPSLLVHEQGRVGPRRHEAQLDEETGDPVVPRPRRLFEAVKRAREETHVAGAAGINKAGRLLAVNALCEMAVEERRCR